MRSPKRRLAVLLVLTLLAQSASMPALAASQAAGREAELKALVREGDFEAAIVKLEEVVRRLEAALQRSANENDFGTLRILIVPSGEVTVDGRSLGTVSLHEVRLPAGPHVVRVVHPEYQPLQRKVTIHRGAVSELVLDLAEKGIRRTL